MTYAEEEVRRRYAPSIWHTPTNGPKHDYNGFQIFDELYQSGKCEKVLIWCIDHMGRISGCKVYFRYEM